MKNILLFLLLFVLSINVLLAQINVDGTTSTSTSDSAGTTINQYVGKALKIILPLNN